MKSGIITKILFLLLLLSFSVFSNGQFAVFFVIWIFTSMLLFAVRKLPKWKGFLLAFFSIGTGYYIGFDVVPFLPVAVSLIIAAIFSVFASLPYLIDSFFSKKRSSFLSTLIFPCSAVVLEYTYHLFNQYGTWGHFAYTQESQITLLQSVSVFGMGYITFLITWFAAVVNWVYAHRKEWKNAKKGVFIYGSVLTITLLYGGIRVQLQKNEIDHVRVASISAVDSLAVTFDIAALNDPETEAPTRIEAKRQTGKLNQYLFDKSIAEAQAGARIVFWAEGNGVILKEDEQDLYRTAGQVASEQNIYLGIGLAVIDHTETRYLENKFVVFDPDGEKAMDYWKAISVPGAEAPFSNNQATGIQKIESEYGMISGAICFDLDFPRYIQQAKGADIFLAPSNDFKEIDPIHTDMAKFRAIENGFNLIRHTSHGLSVGTDYTGTVISEMDHFNDNDKVLITQLPTRGVKTVYAVIGDAFVGFCLLLLVFVIVLLGRRKDGDSNLDLEGNAAG